MMFASSLNVLNPEGAGSAEDGTAGFRHSGAKARNPTGERRGSGVASVRTAGDGSKAGPSSPRSHASPHAGNGDVSGSSPYAPNRLPNGGSGPHLGAGAGGSVVMDLSTLPLRKRIAVHFLSAVVAVLPKVFLVWLMRHVERTLWSYSTPNYLELRHKDRVELLLWRSGAPHDALGCPYHVTRIAARCGRSLRRLGCR